MKIKTKKIELHELLTSMNSLSYSVISYGIFYGIKQAAFFFKLFEYLIPSQNIRLIPSVFFGFFISRAMLNIASNISENKEWVITSIAIFDFLVLCVIIDILKQENWISRINLLIFCAFVTYLGYWLNKVFIDKVKEKQIEASLKQKTATTEHYLATLKQNSIDIKQELIVTEQNLTLKKQELADIKQEIEDTTCPHCLEKFPSKKSRDAHKGRCKSKPQEQMI